MNYATKNALALSGRSGEPTPANPIDETTSALRSLRGALSRVRSDEVLKITAAVVKTLRAAGVNIRSK